MPHIVIASQDLYAQAYADYLVESAGYSRDIDKLGDQCDLVIIGHAEELGTADILLKRCQDINASKIDKVILIVCSAGNTLYLDEETLMTPAEKIASCLDVPVYAAKRTVPAENIIYSKEKDQTYIDLDKDADWTFIGPKDDVSSILSNLNLSPTSKKQNNLFNFYQIGITDGLQVSVLNIELREYLRQLFDERLSYIDMDELILQLLRAENCDEYDPSVYLSTLNLTEEERDRFRNQLIATYQDHYTESVDLITHVEACLDVKCHYDLDFLKRLLATELEQIKLCTLDITQCVIAGFKRNCLKENYSSRLAFYQGLITLDDLEIVDYLKEFNITSDDLMAFIKTKEKIDLPSWYPSAAEIILDQSNAHLFDFCEEEAVFKTLFAQELTELEQDLKSFARENVRDLVKDNALIDKLEANTSSFKTEDEVAQLCNQNPEDDALSEMLENFFSTNPHIVEDNQYLQDHLKHIVLSHDNFLQWAFDLIALWNINNQTRPYPSEVSPPQANTKNAPLSYLIKTKNNAEQFESRIRSRIQLSKCEETHFQPGRKVVSLGLNPLFRFRFFEEYPQIHKALLSNKKNPLILEGKVGLDEKHQGELFLSFPLLEKLVHQKIRAKLGDGRYSADYIISNDNDSNKLETDLSSIDLKDDQSVLILCFEKVHAYAVYITQKAGQQFAFVFDSQGVSPEAEFIHTIKNRFPGINITCSKAFLQYDYYSCGVFAIKALMYFAKEGHTLYDKGYLNQSELQLEDLPPQLLKLAQPKLIQEDINNRKDNDKAHVISSSKGSAIVSRTLGLSLFEYREKHQVIIEQAYASAAFTKRYKYMREVD